ncbi:MAG: FAD-binding protein [Spirochaetales bacterium]|nr:FAD-binding protein [Spirochaetales bacterium]
MKYAYHHTIVLGTGAASLCAAVRLKRSGIDDILIITDNLKGGTSRNTGSDKQTYYKLSDSTINPDSPYAMARALSSGGAMHGDLALAEALGSESGFYHLTALGVPFPFNRWGGYTGYKTDHDPLNRGTSLGPYTSRMMVEYLEKEVINLGIPILDSHDAVRLVTIEENDKKRIAGLIALERNKLTKGEEALKPFLCDNLIFGVGGPAGLYKSSVYPPVHVGAIGLALEVGAETANLTESQYGMGSLKFRWNLSGSYQQVLPRYFSRDKEGREFDFLSEYFKNMTSLTRAIFLKGYQWPFDPLKVENEGSSLIDILVYRETEVLGRDVFMDFRSNPWDESYDLTTLDSEVREYWDKSGLTGSTPIIRLEQLNKKAISLYGDHNIDLYGEPLQIGVCAQHNNGGLAGDIWWESTNIGHLFPVGEVNGTHGVYRPGGTALNSGQVGAFRASQKIARAYGDSSLNRKMAEEACGTAHKITADLFKTLTANMDKNSSAQKEYREEFQNRMSRHAAFVRDSEQIDNACSQALEQLERFSSTAISHTEQLPYAFRNRHMALAQYFYLESIRNYLEEGGGSRGSYIVRDKEGISLNGDLEQEWSSKVDRGELKNKIQHLSLKKGKVSVYWEESRPIPREESWFETVWGAYLEGSIFKE